MSSNMINVKATFIGENGSEGFMTGKPYDLVMWEDGDMLWIQRVGGGRAYGQQVPYSGFRTFLNNWKSVSMIKK